MLRVSPYGDISARKTLSGERANLVARLIRPAIVGLDR